MLLRKSFVYPENLPEGYQLTEKTRHNYDGYLKVFDSLNVPLIDFNQWFLDLKGKSEYPIFARGGKHWAHYYASRAIDRVARSAVYGMDVRQIDSTYTWKEKIAYPPDVDIWNASNLYSRIHDEGDMVRCEVFFDEGKRRKSLVFADSLFSCHPMVWLV